MDAALRFVVVIIQVNRGGGVVKIRRQREIGIVRIGGIGPLAPSRRKDISALGMKAVLGGVLATLMTATIAGILLG